MLHFDKMWIKICHLETGKGRILAGIFFIIVQEFCKGKKVADSFVDLVLCFLLMLYFLRQSVMLQTVCTFRQ